MGTILLTAGSYKQGSAAIRGVAIGGESGSYNHAWHWSTKSVAIRGESRSYNSQSASGIRRNWSVAIRGEQELQHAGQLP